ncbi:MAG: molybdate ABC transporter substrate-binding protein [Kiritimatiellae bacterium]|nr:molybdate ABC transporter substrate-binding protein [Kiritimatiellia bacterium]MDD5523004.1 molybdate ABC transporter substrate-binding protein [Kiritimatiellia bacterium]
MTKRIIIVAVLILVVAVSGIMLWNRSHIDKETGQKELVLYCGAGIRPGASAVIEAFMAKNNIRIIPTYEGSGQSLGKISAGAGGDLFMPGSEFYVDKAIEKGLIGIETKKIVAYFIPVLLVQKGNPKAVQTLQDLKKSGIRVGIGDERSAAVGKATMDILKKNGIAYEDVAKNVVYKSGTVDELGVAIQMKTVDVVVLWDVNARHFNQHGDIIQIPPEQNVPSVIPIAVLKSTRHPDEAGKFTEFATSSEGKQIMADHGFTIHYPDKSGK